MKRTLTALTIAATMFASSASAFDSKIIEILQNLSITKVESIRLGREDGTLEERNKRRERRRSAQEGWENYPKDKIDLSSADLSGIYLADINLVAADLSGSNLSYSILGGANLRGADLTNANLSAARLREADLTSAMMNSVILCNTTMPDGSVIYSGC